LPVDVRVDGDERRLSPEVEMALFRVAQEAPANAWKHAQAPRVDVQLSFGEGAIELVVEDRGRGLAVPERVGALRVASEPGRGTTVTARGEPAEPEDAGGAAKSARDGSRLQGSVS
jgi:signal transduction histidine kinase